jgi:hypothetical protein
VTDKFQSPIPPPLTQTQESSESFLKSLESLSPTELETFLESVEHLPESEQLKIKESLERATAGRMFSLLEEMEEYQKNPQMNEILATFLRICEEDKLDPEMVVGVLCVLRSAYLQFHGLEPTIEGSHHWPESKYAQLLYGNVKVDHAFRLRAEYDIRQIMKSVADVEAQLARGQNGD